jgi:hypothetical protein
MIARPIRRAHIIAALLAGALVISPQLWAGRDRKPGLLWGGGMDAPPAPTDLDPRLPTGAMLHTEPRPQHLPMSFCSLREPVCIHHAANLPLDSSQAYLSALEEARALLVGALGLPAPLEDPGLGPTSGLDLYVLQEGPSDVAVVADPRRHSADRSSAHCRARPLPEEYRRQATLCVGEALLFRLDAAETPYLRRAIAAYLWNTVGQPTKADLDAIDTFQANPQLGVAGRDLASHSAGAALFFHYTDQRLGLGRPGTLPAALVQLSRAHTKAGQPQWHNEPDAIDVLRHAFDASEESFGDFMLNFAVQRAFLGSRDNGGHDPRLLWLGDAGRVRFDWTLKASSLPRRVAPLRPLQPFGSAYIWLELDQLALGTTLAFRANWEAPSTFRFTLAAVDAEGNLLKRHDLPYVPSATSAERTLVDYEGAAALLIVGTNLGDIDRTHPFDPDHEPFEPHGFTVYIAAI